MILENRRPNDIDWELVNKANLILELSGTPIPLITNSRELPYDPINVPKGSKLLYDQSTDSFVLDPEVDQFVEEVKEAAELTNRETQIVHAILQGDVWGPHTGGYRRVAQAIK